MRWYWIDRYIEFESGRRAKALKAVSAAEDHLHDHFPDYPMIPNSLVIEGIAQTGGLLVCEHHNFAAKIVLAKIQKARFHCEAVPGDVLTYTATIVDSHEDGAMVSATSHKGEVLHAEVDLMFAHLADDQVSQALFEPGSYVRMLRMLGAFDVGHAADGGPLVEPPDQSPDMPAEGPGNL